ncbi:aKG-HExxH-type peptide beta-hydroxylase [Streptomyces bungoensis]
MKSEVTCGRLGALPAFCTLEKIESNRLTLADFAGYRQAADYFNALDDLQSVKFPRPADVTTSPFLSFDTESPDVAAIVNSIIESAELPITATLSSVAHHRIQPISQALEDALKDLASFDERAEALVRHLVASVILVDISGCEGGSFWHALGVVWLSPGIAWSVEKYAESLLHESVHQATFLDDMVNRIFSVGPDAMAASDSLIISPIREVRRRFDFTLHATAVAIVLARYLDYRQSIDRASRMLNGASTSLREMSRKRQFLTEYGNDVLDELARYHRGTVTDLGY